MRGFSILAALVALLGSLWGTASAKGDDGAMKLYVSTGGNDAWSGRLAAPNAAKTDGPFATLERARDEVRKMKAGGDARSYPRGIAVLLRGGLYCLDKTLVLSPQDSGAAGAPVI